MEVSAARRNCEAVIAADNALIRKIREQGPTPEMMALLSASAEKREAAFNAYFRALQRFTAVVVTGNIPDRLLD